MSLSYSELKRREKLHNAFVETKRSKNGWASYNHGEDVKALGFHFTNNMRSKLEIRAFMKEKPEKYFCYMHKDESGKWILTNFIGKTLGTVKVTSVYRFYGNLSNEKIYFRAKGINGINYIGIGYGEGVYCRIRKAK